MRRIVEIEEATGLIVQVLYREVDGTPLPIWPKGRLGFVLDDRNPNHAQVVDARARAAVRWNADTQAFEARPPAPPKPPVLALRDFFRLFTPAQVAAVAAARDGGDVDVQYFWTYLTIEPGPVDLGHPAVAQGLALLVAKDILPTGEAVRILAGQAPA